MNRKTLLTWAVIALLTASLTACNFPVATEPTATLKPTQTLAIASLTPAAMATPAGTATPLPTSPVPTSAPAPTQSHRPPACPNPGPTNQPGPTGLPGDAPVVPTWRHERGRARQRGSRRQHQLFDKSRRQTIYDGHAKLSQPGPGPAGPGSGWLNTGISGPKSHLLAGYSAVERRLPGFCGIERQFGII